MKKEELYAAILTTVYGSDFISAQDATDFLLGNFDPAGRDYARIVFELVDCGLEETDIKAALPDLKIVVGLQALFRKCFVSRNDALYMLRLIADMLERPREGIRLLHYVAALVEETLDTASGAARYVPHRVGGNV